MSVRSNTPTGYINNTRDSNNRIIHELRNVVRALQSGISVTVTSPVYQTGAGTTTADTLRVTLDTNTLSVLQYGNWDIIPGNSKEFTWIAGALPNSRLVDTIVYKTGAATVVTQTFTYDPVTDEVLSIVAS